MAETPSRQPGRAGRPRKNAVAALPVPPSTTGRTRSTKGRSSTTRATETYHFAVHGLPPEDPREVERNLKAHGYTCPRDNYIFGPADINSYKIAKIWGCNHRGVEIWIERQGWNEAKRKHLESLPDVQGGLKSTGDLDQLRQEHLHSRLALADEMIAKAKAFIEKGTEERMSASGAVKTMELSIDSMRKAYQIVENAIEIKNVALGVPNKLTGAFAGATVNTGNSITSYTVVRPGESSPAQPHPALPAPGAVSVEEIDGEVTER